MIATHAIVHRGTIVVAVVVCLLAGCATNRALMPTPALYIGPNAKPLFTDSPIERRPPTLDLFFVTDRAPADGTSEVPYTAERSRALAFGSTMIEFGEGVTLAMLARQSATSHRAVPMPIALGATTELGRFPATPYPPRATGSDGMRRAPAVVEAHEEAKRRLQSEIATRLAIARRKEVVLFVHGYHTSFESAALTMGELCHFLGREFVCGIFTWPAGGQRGILIGYHVDRESAEYAVEDLVKAIRTRRLHRAWPGFISSATAAAPTRSLRRWRS